MPGDNGLPDASSTLPPNQSGAPVVSDVAHTKIDLARQLSSASGPGDGGILAQLTSNPFFTAVCAPNYRSMATNV